MHPDARQGLQRRTKSLACLAVRPWHRHTQTAWPSLALHPPHTASARGAPGLVEVGTRLCERKPTGWAVESASWGSVVIPQEWGVPAGFLGRAADGAGRAPSAFAWGCRMGPPQAVAGCLLTPHCRRRATSWPVTVTVTLSLLPLSFPDQSPYNANFRADSPGPFGVKETGYSELGSLGLAFVHRPAVP